MQIPDNDLLKQYADFTWNFGMLFFVETSIGNFIWSDPDYGGDNSFRKTNQTINEFFGSSFGRCKGKHKIENYCGSFISIIW